MTRFRSSLLALSVSLIVPACAHSSGAPASAIAQPEIAAAYLPLSARVHLGLDSAVGAGVVIQPGIAVTNAHNDDLVNEKSVLGVRQDYDLMFFRTARQASPPTALPVVGQSVTAYGQGSDRELRVAHGTVRRIVTCPAFGPSAYFIFAANAGPGFSGGPVLDAAGRLVGITFGYKDEGGERLIYAYDMERVRAELSAVQKRRN